MRQSDNMENDMSIADRFITAMFLPSEYPALLKLKTGKVVSYLCVLILLACMIQYAIPVLGAIAGNGGVRNYIMYQLPEFSLENGVLDIAERIEVDNEEAGLYVLVDTDADRYTEADVEKTRAESILVSSTNILMYNNVAGLGGMAQEQKFSEFKDAVINNKTIADMTPFIYIMLLVMFGMLYIASFARYLFLGLCYGILMHLLVKVMMGNMSFGDSYKVALFAQSVGVIVSALAYFIGQPVIIMTASAFAMFVTIIIMNRVLFRITGSPRDVL